MTTKPWNNQPTRPSAEAPQQPSAIIPPSDQITVTIDNYAQGGPRAAMVFSRPLPVPYVCHLLAGLIRDLIEQGAASNPITLPAGNPHAGNLGKGGIHGA